MVHHGFCPPTFICANIIPIPKGSKANLSDSDKYRSISISSVLGKILDAGLGSHVGASYTGAFRYADDIALVALSLHNLRKMIRICEQYAKTQSITFNPNKSKLLCYIVDEAVDIPPMHSSMVR